MTAPTTAHHPGLARIARPSGTFAMVAMDQRESLRAMFAERLPGPIDLERRVDFKLAVTRILSPHASGILVDRAEGLDAILEAGVLDPGCGLIVAADELVQPTGGLVQETALDRDLDLPRAVARGAVAAKLLVIWKPDRSAATRAASSPAGPAPTTTTFFKGPSVRVITCGMVASRPVAALWMQSASPPS